MKQVCAMCGGFDVSMITDGKSSDRVERYVCHVCETQFYAKRPTKRVGQKERGRLEYLDKMAGHAMQGFIACQARQDERRPDPARYDGYEDQFAGEGEE